MIGAASDQPAATGRWRARRRDVGIGKRFGDLIALDNASVRDQGRQRACAARRERRRQIDAGQMHHGLLPARRRQRDGRRPRGRDRQSAPGARARARHGLPAFHPGAAHDRAGEHGDGARRRAGGDQLARRAQAVRCLPRHHAVHGAARRPGRPRWPPARSRRPKSSSSSISRAASSSSTSRPRCSRPTRPTKSSA